MIHIPEQLFHTADRNINPSFCLFQSITEKSTICLVIIIFFHPDYTVGFGVTPNHALRLVGYTTGRESHPALKTFYLTMYTIYNYTFFVKIILYILNWNCPSKLFSTVAWLLNSSLAAELS